jgi:drug/metabolite transporter (DMT)-like permease
MKVLRMFSFIKQKERRKPPRTPQSLADNKKRAVLMTVSAGLLWGTSFPAIKIGLQFVDPYTFVFLRFLVTALVLSLIMMVMGRKFSSRPFKKRLILFLGVINGVAYLLQYLGMAATSASESSLLVNLSVVWVAMLSAVILKEHLGIKKIAAIGLSLLGVILISTNLEFTTLGKSSFVADFLVISAGFLWAVFIVYNKPLLCEGNNVVKSMTWLMLFTMIPLLPILLFSAGHLAALPLNAWLAIFYTGLFCWVVPYYLWLEGLKHISAVTSSIVLLTEIVVAISISSIFLGEVLTVSSALGGVLILFAILIVSLTDKANSA